MKKTRTILVTGGCGFIGSNFIRLLLTEKKRSRSPVTRVINLDKLTYSGNPENLKDIERDGRYRFVRGDIADRKTVDELARRCDVIVNFAAESHVDRSIKDPGSFIRTNIVGTQVLLDALRKYAKKGGASKDGRITRFVQISTDEVYGSVARGYSNERSRLLPNSPYSATKTAADLLARSYCVTFGLPVCVTRSSNNFGPYQYPEKVIPLFITNLIEGKKVPLYADGKNVRDWIYVMDNCEAIRFVMERGMPGEIYNIGGGNELSNITLTKMILKMLGKPESFIQNVKDRPGHDKRYAVDSSKLRRLGWRQRPKNMKEKLRETIEWYRENRTWWECLKKKKEKFW
ncbi:MAG: dTDP-glucose 4,6-dehydratase [Candidatus Omnitrophota bacterium]